MMKEIEVRGLHRAHPEWTYSTLAYHTGLTQQQVKEILKRKKRRRRRHER